MVLTGNWANKYGYFSTFKDTPNDPTSMNYGGDCAERLENLQKRGYGLYSAIGERYSVLYWQENCSRLEEEQRLLKIQKAKNEEQRLFEIELEKYEEERLQIELERQRKENEIKRQEMQKLMEAEKLLKTPENIIEKPESLSLISSAIPLGIIGFLLINSRNDKN